MASPAPPAGGGGKFLGLRPRTALIIGGVAIALAFFYFRRKKAAPSSVSVTASGAGSGVDYSGELSVIQAELEQLLAQQGQPVTSGGGGGTPGGGGSGSGSGSGSGDGSGGTGSGGKTHPPTGSGGSGGPGKPPMPTGVHATKTGSDSVTLAWNKSPGATSYKIRVTYQGKLVHQSTTAGNSATVSGLGPDHTYTFHVAAVGPGGTSAETNGPAVKTHR